jgi:hypothetical protein
MLVDAVSIADEIPGRMPIGEGLDDLLRCPGSRGMLGHIEVQHLATTMFQHENTNRTLIVIVGTVKKSIETI